MDPRTEQFVEQMGLLSESDGLPRIAGRIFGYLLVQRAECSIDDLASALGVSRASVSTDARQLATIGLIERRGRPGDRRDYYAMADDGVRRVLELRIRSLQRFHELLTAAGDLPDVQADPAVCTRVANWDHAHARLVAAFGAVVDELKG